MIVPEEPPTHLPRRTRKLIRDIKRLGAAAKKTGLRLSGYQSDAEKALYLDVTYEGIGLGFVYRGWDDPGFGVGDVIMVSAENMPLFGALSGRIFSRLATDGLAVTVHPLPTGGCCLAITSAIYSPGFNARVFGATLRTVAEATAWIERLMA